MDDLPTVPFLVFVLPVPAFIAVSVFKDDLSDTMFVLLVAAFLAVAIGLLESDTVFAWGSFALALVTIVAGWQVTGADVLPRNKAFQLRSALNDQVNRRPSSEP